MMVKDLVKKLLEVNQNYRVVVDGYEGGVDDMEKIKVINIALNANEEAYYGDHEELSDTLKDRFKKEGYKIVKAVYLTAR
jgi:hypothetical protein